MEIEINGSSYPLPTWETIPLRKYLEFIRKIYPSRPARLKSLEVANNELQDLYFYTQEGDYERKEREPMLLKQISEIANGLTDVEFYNQYVPYFCRYISHFTGIPLATLSQNCDPNEVRALFDVIGQLLILPEEKADFTTVILGGETYHLPKQLLKNSCVEEFAYITQAQDFFQRTEGNSHIAFPEMLATLLQKESESFFEIDKEARKTLFLDVLMCDVWQVNFFLQRLATTLKFALPIYTLMLKKQALQQAD